MNCEHVLEPASRHLNTVDDLFQSIRQIDRMLARFQKEMLPLFGKFGVDLSRWALSFGDSFRRGSQELYQRVQQRVLARGGGYLYKDLGDLNQARRKERLANFLQQAGVVGPRVVDGLVRAINIFGQASARASIMRLLGDLKEQLPVLQDLTERSEARIARFLKNDDLFFQLLGSQHAVTGAERQKIDHDLGRVVESYRRLYEALARLEYYKAVFNVVARFEPYTFEKTMQDLQEKGVRDRQLYLLSGQAYLERLDKVIARLTWEGPYYQNGLPEGVRFFMGEGRRLLPPRVQLSSLDDAKERIRNETPGLLHTRNFFQAVLYASQQLGNPLMLSPIKPHTLYKVIEMIGLLVVGLLFFLSGAAAAFWNSLIALLGTAWKSLTAVLPVRNVGQLVAIVFITLIMMVPFVWMAYLWTKRSH